MKQILLVRAAVCAAFFVFFSPAEIRANDPQKLVEDSAALAKSLLTDPKWSAYQAHFTRAKAVVLAPDVIRAGIVVGGSAGQCLIVVREANTGGWSAPSFCAMGEATVGIQIGFEKLEVMLLIMTQGALDRIVSGTVTLGGEAGISMGLVGSTIETATTLNLDYDILAFARGQGFYGGVTIDGGYIGPDKAYNHAYYGRRITARDILYANTVDTSRADVLLSALRITP